MSLSNEEFHGLDLVMLNVIRDAKYDLTSSWGWLSKRGDQLARFHRKPVNGGDTRRAWRALHRVAVYHEAVRFFRPDPSSSFADLCAALGSVDADVLLGRLERYLRPPCDLRTMMSSLNVYMVRWSGREDWMFDDYEVEEHSEAAAIASLFVPGGLVKLCR